MKITRLLASSFFVVGLALSGCTQTAQTTADIAQSLSTATATQARTLAEALQAAKLCTDAVDLYVNTGNPSRATLVELGLLNDQVHGALLNLQAADAAGQSLALAGFNEALKAFTAYYMGVKK